jgi:hypothetical protein
MTSQGRRRLVSALGIGAAWLAFGLAPPSAAQPPGDFEHLTTRFPLTGAHVRVPCEGCHLGGVFSGTPIQCGQCHTRGGPRQADGKSLQHLPSSDQCGDCHVTNWWTPARFDHSGVTSPCATCHNGGFATGKPPNHVPSSNDCQACHGTLSWVPAFFDHASITTNCFTCHNGTLATGKHPGHIQSSNACETCHNTRSWEGARFDHATITGNCSSCHDGRTATGTSPGHFVVTGMDCVECHRTSAWLPTTFRHTSPNYPGDHAGNLDCRACHTSNSAAVAWRFPSYAPDCAGCHADDFRPDPHRKVESPQLQYTVSELRDCSGACHTYADATLTTLTRSRSGQHSVRSGGW